MKKLIFAVAAIAGLMAATSCSDEHEYILSKDGSVVFSTSFSNDVKVASRASAEELREQLSESAIVWISSVKENGGGVVRKFNGLASIPTDGVKLAGGNYVAELWAGDSVPASFDKKYYKGRTEFSINGATAQVALNGRIANVVASVLYDSTVDEVLSDLEMTVGHDRGSLKFEGRDDRKGYFMMPSTDKNLTWKLVGQKKDGSMYTRTGVIENVNPCTEYILKVKYTQKPTELGGGWLDIEIDSSEIAIEDEITIVLPPTIQGYGFDLSSTIYGEQFAVGRKSLYITAAAALKHLFVESDLFVPVIGGNDFDAMVANGSVLEALNVAGINWVYNYVESADISNLKLNFEDEFMNSLDYGDYEIKVKAEDVLGNVTEAALVISISDAKVIAQPVPEDALTTRATSVVVSAMLADDEAYDYGIEYTVKGGSDWTKVYAAASRAKDEIYTVTLTGLKPGTTYQYRPFCTLPGGEVYVGNALEVTTEQALQLPNAGFEDWTVQSGRNPTLLYASGQSMFWDSGNHGSATMKVNVTTPSSDINHSGNYSACLQSQFVSLLGIGKFAAGNAFIGKYLATDGTDGVLGFGRPFTSRPTSLRAWIKYNPVAVDYPSDNVPDLKKGDMDEGTIYFALTDGSIMDKEYPEYPVVVKTKSAQFFNDSREDVIAKGRYNIKQTEGGGMVEVVIPFEYVRDAKPKYIIMTIAASRGGDYFCGGNGSTLWVDDLELIYE